MKLTDRPKGRHEQIVMQEVRDEILLYDLHRDKALCLNPTSALVWRECDGTKSVVEISRAVSAKAQAPVGEDVIWFALDQFKKENLLADSVDLATPFDGLSRREAVARLGFASLVALPAVFGIVAPRAAQAQSQVCAPIGNCTSGSVGTCTCTPIVQPGSNNNPDGCRCATNGDCIGNCSCGNPCTAPACPPGQTCQSGVCNGGGVACTTNAQCPAGQVCQFGECGLPCNGTCPAGVTCITDPTSSNFGSCAGVCPTSPFNFCVDGNTTNPICIPNNGGNLSANCCPCTIDGDCIGDCSNNNVPNTVGVCITAV